MNTKLRIAWFSDLSFGREESLSAYCTRLIVPKLARHHEIEIFSDQYNISDNRVNHELSQSFGAPVSHYLTAYKRHEELPFDLFFYQLEDSRGCRFIRGHIGLIPGVVWVHDLFCNDLGPEACHTSPWEQTIKQFFDSSLDFSDRQHAPHQLWPRAFRETSLAPVVLFSSEWAKSVFSTMISNRLEARDGGHQSALLPVPVDPSLKVFKGNNRRSKRPETFNIATLSLPGVEGRGHKFLPVLKSLPFDWRLNWLLDTAELSAAKALVNEFQLPDERVIFHTQRSLDNWNRILGAAREPVTGANVEGAITHLALHLHTSPFGHLAPFIQSSLMRGCPVVTARSAQGDDIPDEVAFKITPGVHEGVELRAIINEIMKADNKGDLVSFGGPGVEYASEFFDLDRVVERLSNTLVTLAPEISYVMQRWQGINKRARSALLKEVQALVSAAGAKETFNAYDRVIARALLGLV